MLLPDVEDFRQAPRDQRVDAEPVARGESCLLVVGVGRVGALDEPRPCGVRLSLVQDASDLGIPAPVQTDSGDLQPIVPGSPTAGPGGDLGDRALRLFRRIPRGAERQRAAEGQRAALVGLPIDSEHFGGDAVPLVDGGDATGGIAPLRVHQRPQAVGLGEARRGLHQRELDHLDEIVLDEHAGGLPGGVPKDLDALGRDRVAGDAGAGQGQAVGHGTDRGSVPVAPDAADVHGMVGRGGVEVGARRPALLGQAARSVAIERRAPHGHRDDPLPL